MKKVVLVTILIAIIGGYFVLKTHSAEGASQDPRCVASIDLPSQAEPGQQINGWFFITNTTQTADIWFDIVYASDFVFSNPLGSHIMGLPGVKRQVGIMAVIDRSGFYTATAMIDGTQCVVVSHYVQITSLTQTPTETPTATNTSTATPTSTPTETFTPTPTATQAKPNINSIVPASAVKGDNVCLHGSNFHYGQPSEVWVGLDHDGVVSVLASWARNNIALIREDGTERICFDVLDTGPWSGQIFVSIGEGAYFSNGLPFEIVLPPTSTPTETDTPTPTATEPTDTPTPTATVDEILGTPIVETPTFTPTATALPTETPTVTPTATQVVIIGTPETVEPTSTATPTTVPLRRVYLPLALR